jgi:hypothetical protein
MMTRRKVSTPRQSRDLPWPLQKSGRLVKRLVFSKMYRDRNRELRANMIVAGTARSGTTWLAEIIASQLNGRLVHEPFHPILVPDFRQFHYFQYMRPEEQDEALTLFCQRLFGGTMRNRWMDRYVDKLRPTVRVVKAIRANLFLKWLHRKFPDAPQLLIIRHPCAVAASRMKLGWATDDDIASFLAQPKLIEDHLADKMAIIKSATTDAQKHAIIWCVHHLVPFRQFEEDELPIVYYEDLCLQPEVEIPRVFAALGQSYDESVFARLPRPSLTSTGGSAVIAEGDRVSGWRKSLSARQISEILGVVEAFGLAHLYGDGDIPLFQNRAWLPSAEARNQ